MEQNRQESPTELNWLEQGDQRFDALRAEEIKMSMIQYLPSRERARQLLDVCVDFSVSPFSHYHRTLAENAL